MREKLIELLNNVQDYGTKNTYEEHSITVESKNNETVADALIANGVTIQKWIPVAERLPNAHDSCIVYRKSTFGHFSMLRYTPALGFHFYDSEWGDVTVDNVTHWMPLPEPPAIDK